MIITPCYFQCVFMPYILQPLMHIIRLQQIYITYSLSTKLLHGVTEVCHNIKASRKVWTIFFHIVSSQPDGNECVAVLNIINETDSTCIRLFYLFSQVADFVLETYLTCSVRLGYVRLMIAVIRQMFSWIVTKTRFQVGKKKNSVFVENGHKFIHKRFLCLVTRQKSNSSVCCQIEKNFAGEEGCTLVRHQSSGGTNLFGKIICSFCFSNE